MVNRRPRPSAGLIVVALACAALAALLVCQEQEKRVVRFPMAGVVCLVQDEAGGWSLDWIVTPEIVT